MGEQEKCHICGAPFGDEKAYPVDLTGVTRDGLVYVHYRCLPTVAKRTLNLSRTDE